MKAECCAAASATLRPSSRFTSRWRDTAAYAANARSALPPRLDAELSQLEYEISVLSPLRRVTDIEQIKVGRDGLFIENGDDAGLLLPQVPVEQNWDLQTF